MSEHTPGPWGMFWNEENARLGLGCWRFTHEQHHALPLLRCTRQNKTAEANARLIAASPDMLEALKLAADYIKDLDGGDPETESGWKSEELLDVWLKARAAIAKATTP